MNSAINKVIKNHIKLAIFSTIAVILLVTGVTYSLFQTEHENTKNQTISLGDLSIDLTSSSGNILIKDIYPTLSTELRSTDNLYSFSISNTGDYIISYEIYLSDNTTEYLKNNTQFSSYTQLGSEYYQYIDYKLDGTTIDNLNQIYNTSTKRMVVLRGYLDPGASEEHTLQFWLDAGETTETGAPNSLNGTILALNINMEATARTGESESDKTLAALGLSATTRTPDFNTVATTDEGILAAEDDYGTSYYFRGAVENNYVKFAGFYWRIVRINGDGSLRLIYDGTTAHENGTSSTDRLAGTSAFNSSENDNAYVGYMYGLAGTTTNANRCLMLEDETVVDKVGLFTTEFECQNNGGKWTTTAYDATHANVKDSTIKENIDVWYKTNIVDKGYSDAVSDTLFCNDRGLKSGTGTGTTITIYSAYNRLLTNKKPSLKCAQKNDAFTVNDVKKGNGDLTYPVGLLTADEISFAGGKNETGNNKYYLYKGYSQYNSNIYMNRTITPSFYNDAVVWLDFQKYGLFSSMSVTSQLGITPVINLKPEVAQNMVGTGKMDDPYTYTNTSPSTATLITLGLTANYGTPDFSKVATTDEGIFAQEDDYGTSYYFRGAVENNYVKFAGFYWRIIRINGDGSLRIIYDGTTAHENGTSSTDRIAGTSAFNSSNNDNAYVGYMYGLAGTTTDANRCLILENNNVVDKVSTYTTKDECTEAGGKWTTTAYDATHANVKDSTIKENLDSWYKTNIVDKGYSDAVSDTLFCNDRSIGTDLNGGYFSGYTKLGYGQNSTVYGATSRVGPNISNPEPNLKCPQQNDAFTVSDTIKGNGDLTYPVGLITADEAVLAGGRYDGTKYNYYSNSNYYLYKGYVYWSISPYVAGTGAYPWYVYSYLNSGIGSYTDNLVPVINMTADYCQQLEGSGTITDPYTAS